MLQGIGYGFLQSGKLINFKFSLFTHACVHVVHTGVYAVLLLVWKEKSGAILHMINFFFAVGAFFAPLMAKPFLSEETMQVNVSCTEVFNMYDNHWTNLSNNSCMEMAERNCSDDISGRDWLLIDCPDPMADTMFYGWSYLLATIPLLLSFPAFVYYAVMRQNHCKPAPHAGDASGHELLVNRDSPESNFSSLTTSSSDSLYPNTWTYSIIVLVLLFIVTFLYTGLEMSFGSLLFTYAVRSRLHFSKSHATLLNSVFWGFIALGRLASIPLAICTPSTVMLSVSFAGSILSATLMTIYPYHHLAIWFGCALLGISLASVRPSTISWLNEHISASGKAVAVVLAGGSAGILSFPGAVASLVAYLNPISLIYFTMAVLICCSVLWCTLFLFARLSLICNKVPKGDTIYEEGNESVPLQEFSRQTENGGN